MKVGARTGDSSGRGRLVRRFSATSPAGLSRGRQYWQRAPVSEARPTSEMIATLREVASRGGREALRFFRSELGVINKAGPGAFDPVTEGDRSAETVMRRVVERAFPDHGILGEEHPEKVGDGRWRWVLDPIDGTRGFISGSPTWTTLVGLEHDGVPVAGAIAQPYTEELWVGLPDRTLHEDRSGERTGRTSGVTALSDARVQTTDPRAAPQGYFSEVEAAAFADVGARCRVARFSHDAYGYALIALAQTDLVIESSLKRYDVAALVPVIRGAGGVITDWRGEPPYAGGRVVAAATDELHAEALEVLAAVETGS